jgi:hypothetical protein
MEIEQSQNVDISKSEMDDLLKQSLMYQSNVVSDEIVVPSNIQQSQQENDFDVIYNCSISMRAHNNIYDYSDKIANVKSVISTQNALQILVWINSWDIVNIYFSPEILQEYQFKPKISRSQVLEQIKHVFENLTFNNNSQDGLKNVMKSIFNIFSSTVSQDSTILGTSLIDERKSIELTSISELSDTIS